MPQAPVVQRPDNFIQWISHNPTVSICAKISVFPRVQANMHSLTTAKFGSVREPWATFNDPPDKVIRPLNNWGLAWLSISFRWSSYLNDSVDKIKYSYLLRLVGSIRLVTVACLYRSQSIDSYLSKRTRIVLYFPTKLHYSMVVNMLTGSSLISRSIQLRKWINQGLCGAAAVGNGNKCLVLTELATVNRLWCSRFEH